MLVSLIAIIVVDSGVVLITQDAHDILQIVHGINYWTNIECINSKSSYISYPNKAR